MGQADYAQGMQDRRRHEGPTEDLPDSKGAYYHIGPARRIRPTERSLPIQPNRRTGDARTAPTCLAAQGGEYARED